MPINVQGNPNISLTPSGTQNVKIVSWDSTASLPTGANLIGTVSATIIAGTATQAITGAVTLLVGTASQNIQGTVSAILIGTGAPFYQQNATAIGATGTGIIVMGIQSGATTNRGWAFTTTAAGKVFIDNALVSITGSNTSTIVASLPAGDQLIGTVNIAPTYQQNSTGIGATGTGLLVFGIQSGATTARGWAFTTTAAGQVFNVNTAGPYTISGTVTGIALSGSVSVINTVAISGTVTGIALSGTVSDILVVTAGPFYQQNATAIAATGTGVLIMGIQSGATTSRGWAFTTTAAGQVFNVNTAGPYTVTGSGTNTIVASLPAGNQVIGTVGVSLITTMATGTVSVVAIATTADMFSIMHGGTMRYGTVSTAVTYLQILATTSGDTILITSAANKSFVILSLAMNGDGPNVAKIASSAGVGTQLGGPFFIATSGVGMVLPVNQHGWLRTTTGQSLVLNLASSGTVGGMLTYVSLTL